VKFDVDVGYIPVTLVIQQRIDFVIFEYTLGSVRLPHASLQLTNPMSFSLAIIGPPSWLVQFFAVIREESEVILQDFKLLTWDGGVSAGI
jgi:hypothetical protein